MTGNTTSIKESLRLGIEAARAGQKETAGAHLTKVIEQEPENIPALFWLAYVVDSPQKSITLLERVLALDSDNTRAKDGIRWAKKQLGTATTEAVPDDDTSQSTPAQVGEHRSASSKSVKALSRRAARQMVEQTGTAAIARWTAHRPPSPDQKAR